jgi:hypothetical protein
MRRRRRLLDDWLLLLTLTMVSLLIDLLVLVGDLVLDLSGILVLRLKTARPAVSMLWQCLMRLRCLQLPLLLWVHHWM